MEGKFKREGTYVHLWLIHVDVWQKSNKYYKAIILQLNRVLKKRQKDRMRQCKYLKYPQGSWHVVGP